MPQQLNIAGNIPPVLQKGMEPYIPQDLKDILPKISPDPEVWFNGQLISYILRPNEKFSRQFQNFKNSPFSAAFHIRRNDKIKEAPFYNTQGIYMKIGYRMTKMFLQFLHFHFENAEKRAGKFKLIYIF